MTVTLLFSRFFPHYCIYGSIHWYTIKKNYFREIHEVTLYCEWFTLERLSTQPMEITHGSPRNFRAPWYTINNFRENIIYMRWFTVNSIVLSIMLMLKACTDVESDWPNDDDVIFEHAVLVRSMFMLLGCKHVDCYWAC